MRKSYNLLAFPGLRWIAGLFFLYLYIPIPILLILSFNANRSATIWTGFSATWYGRAFSDPTIVVAIERSLIVATIASLTATTVAIAAALGVAKLRRGRSAIGNVIALPLLIPDIVTAVASVLFFVRIGLYNQPWPLLPVIIAHIVFCTPFAYLPIRARLEGLNPAYAEAASDLYASPWRAFRYVTLPLLWPGIIAGFMLAFVISLDDFVITSFVAGAGGSTLPVYIYTLIRVGVSPEVNAVASVMLVVSIGIIILSTLASRRRM